MPLTTNLLEMLLSGGASSILSAGDAGELAASVLLTPAYDGESVSILQLGVEQALQRKPVPVRAFLEALLSSGASDQVAECGLVEDRLFCLLQVIPT